MKAFFLPLYLLLSSSFLFAEIPDSAWSELEKRFTSVRDSFEKSEKTYDGDKETDQKKLEAKAIPYLRSLLSYESAVRLIAVPKDEAEGLDKSSEFSSQEQRSIQKLRQEIRDADRERILAALAGDTDLADDEKASKGILKDELRLDKFFKTNSRKLTSEISKKERDYGKLLEKTNRDDPRRQKLKDEIEVLKDEVASIHEAIFGFRFGSGFREPFDESLEGKAAELLKEIIEEREKVYAFLKGEKSDGGEDEERAGTVGGSFLYSADLGVVLDVSGSMTPHLEKLRNEIEDFFEGPRYREVVGCRLDSCHFEYLRTNRSATTWATMNVMEELISVRGVDTVYWFNDLKDDQDVMSIRRLRNLLMRGGTRFHVKSLGKQPSRELDGIIYDFQS